MKAERDSMRAIIMLGGAVMLILALGILNGEMPAGGALAQEPPPTDLTGEICTGATKIIDGRTYCVMNGRLADCEAIEIDDLNNTDVFDANLTSGDEPQHKDLPPIGLCDGGTEDAKICDPTAPGLCMAGGGTCESGLTSCEEAVLYKDWADLPISPLSPAGDPPIASVEDHRILDWTDMNDSSLHGNCLTYAGVLKKEDFTQSYLANNDRFLYFAQEKITNDGNSTYYWLLTQVAPIIDTSQCTGGQDEGLVLFKLTPGDVRVVVAFAGSGGITVFTNSFTGSATGFLPPAAKVADNSAVFHTGWLGFQKPVVNLALLSAGDGDDDFGPWGGFADSGDIFDLLNPPNNQTAEFQSGEFAEWAVDLRDVFPGVGSLCGQELFVTGLSRAATGQPESVTEPADLKDIVGPKLYSFGSISAEVILTPAVCGDSFTYEVIVSDASGEVVPSSIQWVCTTDNGDPVTFDDGDPLTPNDDQVASGTGTIPRKSDGTAHLVHCEVTVGASGCDDLTVVADDITVDSSLLAISAEVDPVVLKCCTPPFVGVSDGTIPGGVTLEPIIDGGSGTYNVSWSFSPQSLGIACPPAVGVGGDPGPTCTVHIPDDTPCASVGVGILVQDADPIKGECVFFNAEYGFIKKATILQFRQPPLGQNNVSCDVPAMAPMCVVPPVP